MRGVTTDCLKVAGKEPVDREEFTMFVIVGARTDRHFLRREVGIGSSSHCLSGADCMSLVISSMVAGLKEVKLAGVRVEWVCVEMLLLPESQTGAWLFCRRRRWRMTVQSPIDRHWAMREPTWSGCGAEWNLSFAKVCAGWSCWF